jgi:hypothetical protein
MDAFGFEELDVAETIFSALGSDCVELDGGSGCHVSPDV